MADPPAHIVTLSAVLDLQAAVRLRDDLLAHRGQAVEIVGAAVQQVGVQWLQVLLCARASGVADGASMRLVDPSPELAESLERAGAGALIVNPSIPEALP